MNEKLEKGIFKLEGNDSFAEGFTDGGTWNGWESPFFTAENLKKVFFPYALVFSFTDDCIPVAMIDIETSVEVIESTPIWDEDGQEFLLGYAPEGFCFLKV